jgi:hypothetical protein
MQDRPRFDWLRSPYLRRSGLRELESALRSGRVRSDDPGLGVLTELAEDPTLGGRERVRVWRCVTACCEQDQDRQRGELRAEIRADRQQESNLEQRPPSDR